MQASENDTCSLGAAIFGDIDLEDRRRTKRLVEVFEQICRHPGGTLPDKMKSPSQLKALYRLCAAPSVTHEAIVSAVSRHTLERCSERPGTVLIVHDGTELDYTSIQSLTLTERGQAYALSPSGVKSPSGVRLTPSGHRAGSGLRFFYSKTFSG